MSVTTASATPAPEAFAIWTDVNQAAAALEEAIYAQDSASCGAALDSAAQWMRRAQDHAGDAGDEANRDAAAAIAMQLEQWSGLVPTNPTDRAALQQLSLYPYQGVLVGFLANEDKGLNASANLAFVGVLGALALVVGSAAWIDWKQTHGGYARGPRPKVTPLVSIRY